MEFSEKDLNKGTPYSEPWWPQKQGRLNENLNARHRLVLEELSVREAPETCSTIQDIGIGLGPHYNYVVQSCC